MCKLLHIHVWVHHVDRTVLLANAEACCPLPWFQSCFSKCFHTDDELADDSSIAKTGYFSDLGLFSSRASGTNNSNNETKFEHRWTNTFIRIFDLFVSPLVFSPVHILNDGRPKFTRKNCSLRKLVAYENL